jgi:hypothetical protein
MLLLVSAGTTFRTDKADGGELCKADDNARCFEKRKRRGR